MNDQDFIAMQNEKILKREKFDIMLAYILIVILLGAILLVLYFKFIRKEELEVTPDEYTADVITLNKIADAFNEDNTYTVNVLNNEMSISYKDNDTDKTLNIPLERNEVKVTYSNDDVFGEVIYKKIATTICEYNNNNNNLCESNIDNINYDNQIEGIKIEKDDNNTTVYIDINKKIELKEIEEYNSMTIVALSKTNYNLDINNVKISGIKVKITNNIISVSGNINVLDNNTSISVKLYDKDNNLLKENKYEYKDSDTSFDVNFDLGDNLKLKNIKKYSIEVL